METELPPTDPAAGWMTLIGPTWLELDLERALNVSHHVIERLFAEGRIIGIGIPNSSERVVPAFQIRNGRLDPVIAESAHILLAGQGVRPLTAAAWFQTPNRVLGGLTPLEFLAERSPEREDALLKAAGRTRARISM